jgi:predicted short-subunit dehydrogenase-like oxidoreductase (DUF2520 family)
VGQVPATHYGIIGDGRMARHMKHYLELSGASVTSYSRSKSTISAQASLERCDVILLLITDSAIETFILENPFLRNKKLIHFSGALVTPLCQGFHPLMTFGQELYDLQAYERIAFICEQGDLSFEELFPMLPNPHHRIDPELKPLYHSLCVLSGNFTVMLWQKFFTELERKTGVPGSAGVPYLRQIAANIEANPRTALTGPVQRGDAKTIAANLHALQGDPFREVYTAFVQAFQKENQRSL